VEARLIARSRSRLAFALSVCAALLVAGCYSKISEEDGGTLPASEAQKTERHEMTPLEREQAAALAEQRKRVAALAEPQEAAVERKPGAPAERERATKVSVIAPGAGGYWVQIGSGRDETDSETLWTRTKAAHPTILGDAPHAIVRADLGPGKGVFYRVHVGPYDNAAAAGTLCSRLRAAHVDCFLVAPGGAIMQPETTRATAEPAKSVDTAPAKPATGPAKEKPAATASTTPATRTAPAETAKPATAAAGGGAAKPDAAAKADAAAKSSAETETKKPDVPFRSMGLPGLPD
jgi:hypothetical protein